MYFLAGWGNGVGANSEKRTQECGDISLPITLPSKNNFSENSEQFGQMTGDDPFPPDSSRFRIAEMYCNTTFPGSALIGAFPPKPII